MLIYNFLSAMEDVFRKRIQEIQENALRWCEIMSNCSCLSYFFFLNLLIIFSEQVLFLQSANCKIEK